LGVDTTRPDGNVSVKPTPVRVVAFGFVIAKLSAVLAPNNWSSASANAFVIVGGVAATNSERPLSAPSVATPIVVTTCSVSEKGPAEETVDPIIVPFPVTVPSSVPPHGPVVHATFAGSKKPLKVLEDEPLYPPALITVDPGEMVKPVSVKRTVKVVTPTTLVILVFRSIVGEVDPGFVAPPNVTIPVPKTPW